MLTPGAVVDLTVEKPASGGRMIARHEGLVVLVHAAIPGERVRALVDRVGRGVAYATTVDVIEASSDRRTGIADWACGGNVYAHVAYPRQLALKADIVADAFLRIGRIPLDRSVQVHPSPERGYRMRARFHVRGRMLGFFEEGTHRLCDPASSGQLRDDTCDLVRELSEALLEGRLPGVVEIDLAENVEATERAWHLVLDRPHLPAGIARLGRLPTVVGISACSDARRTRGPVTAPSIVAAGRPYVRDHLALAWPGEEGRQATAGAERTPAAPVVSLQHHARAFFQGNRHLVAALAARVVSLVPTGPVLDLYAGVGLFSAALAASGRTPITAVEGDPAAAADLRANTSALGTAVDPVEMAVERYLARCPAAPEATLLVDPPRTGISGEAASAIARQRAGRVVYVSCDVATLARDSRRLVEAGHRLAHVEAFDMFPNTAHVETVAVFTRDASDGGAETVARV